MAGQIALTVGSAAAAAALSQRDDWEPITLFLLLLALSVVSELFRLETAEPPHLGHRSSRSCWR